MASYSAIGTIVASADFQERVHYALAVRAVEIYAEDQRIDGHPARREFASRVFAGNYNIASICRLVLTNATIASNAKVSAPPTDFAIPDGDIQFSVNALWNDLAQV